MNFDITFLGNFEETYSFAKDTMNFFRKSQDDNEVYDSLAETDIFDFEDKITQSKIQVGVFDLRQYTIFENYVNKAKIVVLLLRFSNNESFRFMSEKWISVLQSVSSDNQQRFIVGQVSDDFNTGEYSHDIRNLMDVLKLSKYFEKRSEKFSSEERNTAQLTIYPNFYQFINEQIRQMIDDREGETITKGSLSIRISKYTNEAKVIGLSKKKALFLIPSKITIDSFVEYKSKKCYITSIGNGAFKKSKITSISFANDSCIKKIGNYAFQNSLLSSLSIPDSLEEFGEYWCDGASKLSNIIISNANQHFKYENNILIDVINHKIIFASRTIQGDIIIPNDIKKINPLSFYSCNITSLTINSSNLESIGSYAFAQCTNLEGLSISNTKYLMLSKECFYNTPIKKLFINHGDRISFGPNSFMKCNNLSKIVVRTEHSIEIGQNAISDLNNITSILLIAEHCSLDKENFKNCPKFENIGINAKNNVDFQLFNWKDFNSLTDLSFAAGSTISITKDTFEYSEKLQKVHLHVKDIALEDHCFKGLINNIELASESTITITKNTFESSKNLKYLKLNAQNIVLEDHCFQGLISSIDITSKSPISITKDTFEYSEKLQEVNLHAKVITLEDHCFKGLINNIDLASESTITITKNTFESSNNLSILKLSAQNIVFEDDCFQGLISSIDITSKSSMTITKTKNIFEHLDHLKEIKLTAKNLILEDQCFNNFDKLESATISGQVKIGDGCFNNCRSLSTFIVNGLRLVSIGKDIFNGCQALKEINVSICASSQMDSLIDLALSENSFIGADHLNSVKFIGGSINIQSKLFNFNLISSFSIEQANNVVIESTLFNNCEKLTKLFIESKILRINDNCFNNTGLQSVIFSVKDVRICNNCFNNNIKGQELQFYNADKIHFDSADFCGWENLNCIELCSSFEIILCRSCFNNNKQLETVKIYSNHVAMGTGSFSDCSSLQKVEFVSQVHQVNKDTPYSTFPKVKKINKLFIGDESFNNCSNMSELSIDTEKELHIGKKCFYELLNLKTIKISTELSTIDEGSFDSCPGKDKIPKVYFDISNDQNDFSYLNNYKSSKSEIQKKIDLRKTFDQKYQKLIFQNDECFNSFYILGIQKDNPSIIAMFPPKPSNFPFNMINSILDFCYPQKPTQINQNGQIPHNILDGFVFCFDTPRCLGIVLYISIPSNANNFIGKKYDRSYPFALCLISNNPNISSHFEFLSSIVDSIVNKPNGVIRTVEIPKLLQGQKGECFKGLKRDPKCEYIALSPSSKSLDFLFPDLVDYYVKKYPPTLEQTDYLLYPTLQTLLTFLTPEIVFDIFWSILCGHKIIFYSKHLNRLSFCILAIVNLSNEIEIPIKISPILPDNKEFTQAMTCPFQALFGFYSKYEVLDDDFVYTVYVDIDNGKIEILNDKKPYPPFPYSTKLIKNAKEIFNNKGLKMKIPQKEDSEYNSFISKADKKVYPECFQFFAETKYIFTPKFIQEFSRSITGEFFPKLKEYTKNCIYTDDTDPNNPISVFDKHKFEFYINNNYREFIERLMCTQSFESIKALAEQEVKENHRSSAINGRRNQNIFLVNQRQINSILNKLSLERSISCPNFTKSKGVSKK